MDIALIADDTKKELIQLIHYTNHLDYIADVCSDWEKLYTFDNAEIYENFDISVHVFISSNAIRMPSSLGYP